MHYMETGMGPKTDETKEKIHRIDVRLLDDNTFHYSVHTNKMDSEYSFADVDELLESIKDDLTSPHMKKKSNMGKAKMEKGLYVELKRSGNKK